MADREAILTRLREALRVETAAAVHPDAERIGYRDAMTPGGATPGDQLALFLRHAADLRAECSVGSLPDLLALLAKREGWKRLAACHGPLTDEALGVLGLPVLWTDGGYAKRELAAADAAVTGCDALVAQTGSVLVTARSCGGRALSVLPPYHVVLARKSQLVPDLAAAYEQLHAVYGESLPSSISLITGASRTGDIERILVLGAHGPSKLTILIAED